MLRKYSKKILSIALCLSMCLSDTPYTMAHEDDFKISYENSYVEDEMEINEDTSTDEKTVDNVDNIYIEETESELPSETKIIEDKTEYNTELISETETQNNTEAIYETETQNSTETIPEKETEEISETETQNSTEAMSEEETEETVETESSISLFTDNLSDSDLSEYIENAYNAFQDILNEKNLMALLYHTDEYNVLARAGEYDSIVTNIKSGHTVYITDVDISDYGLWYQVSFGLNGTEYSGYIEDSYLAYSDENWIEWKNDYLNIIYDNQLVNNCKTSSDIDAFPSAYHEGLNKLKQQHPNWTFVPMNTGLDFNTVVSNEMGDKSYIQNTSSNIKKGWVGEAYSGSWYYATKSAVEYHINPLNFLNEDRIFQFEQLTFNESYHTEAAIQNFLDNTFMKGVIPDNSITYANAFFEIGKKRKLSPIHLASRVYQEQGKGTSPLISGTYKGYEGFYNYFNVGAFGNTNEEVIENGLKYAKSKEWNTHYKSIAGGADTIGNGYILKGQDTLYLQKFNVDGSFNKLYTHQYMQNIQAPSSEAYTTKKMYNNAGSLDSAFVFKIPVYKNIPGGNPEPSEPEDPEEPEEPSNPEEPENPIEIPVTSVTIVNTNDSTDSLQTTLITGQTITLLAEYLPKNTTSNTTIIWASSNTEVACVSNGKVTALSVGLANISATIAGITATYTINVKPIEEQLPQEGLYITPVSDRIYTGSAIKPEIKVYDIISHDSERELTELTPNKDYTISYKNNKNVNTNSNNKPTITVKGCGNYKGTHKIYFNILPKSINSSDIRVDNITTSYNGKSHKSKPSIYDGSKKLTLDTDYTVSYPDNSNNAYKECGTYVISISGKGNYTGETNIYQRITKKIPINKVTISKIPNQVYKSSLVNSQTGMGITPKKINVTYNDKKLVENKDYTISYINNLSIGTATAIITATGESQFSGSKKVNYKIVGTSLSTATVKGITSKTFSNNEKDMYQNNITVSLNGEELKESTDNGITGDYKITYSNMSKSGNATITIKGINDYSGSLKKTFKITPYNINNGNNMTASNIKIAYCTENAPTNIVFVNDISQITSPYMKGGAKPVIKLYYNDMELTLGKDFTVKYTNNKVVTTSDITQNKLPKITISGKGNFKGSISGNWTITNCTLSDTNKVIFTAKDVVYKNKPNSYKSSLSVKDANGAKLSAGIDYDKNVIYTYANDTVITTKEGEHINRNAGEIVSATDIIEANTYITATIKGIGLYKGIGTDATLSSTYRVIASDISQTEAFVKNKNYLNGQPVKLLPTDIKLMSNNLILEYGKDYIIDETTYQNNTKKGKASVIIRGISQNYGGEKKLTYNITSKLFAF